MFIRVFEINRKSFLRITSVFVSFSLAFLSCSCSKSDNDFDGSRFEKTRHISVLVDSVTDFETEYTVDSSRVAQFLHNELLKDCNIDVQFIESSKLNFNYGVSADISFVSDSNILNTYYRMGSVVNIAPFLNDYAYSLKDLSDILGEENIHFCNDYPNEVWYLTNQDFSADSQVTFIRSDWLKTLGLDVPSNREELYNCLIEFRDNADILLGEDASQLIPFLVDNNPSVSAKPLFDSCLDTSIDDKDFYVHGYCRATQAGYKDALEILNVWYLQDLLPKDYQNIRPNTKETYEPVENGFVGAFCAKYDYLYKNGENSHIKSFYDNCGDGADYIAVNTFENSYGEYTSWHEDYLFNCGRLIFLPSTCSDPLACLVYLNWISKSDNIVKIRSAYNEADINDPFTSERYLITSRNFELDLNLYDIQKAEEAFKTAHDVKWIHRGNKCVRYNNDIFMYIDTETDIITLYPDSTRYFVCSVISCGAGEFENVYSEQFDKYLKYGSYNIVAVRYYEWDKVMEKGIMLPM